MKSLLWLMLARPWYRRRNARALAASIGPDGIEEAGFVPIAGIDHYLTIRGRWRSNPVLVFLHGGPGGIQTIFNTLTIPWEHHFTIVQYDQRGSGKTVARSGPPGQGELTLPRLEEDARAVIEYVRGRLGVDRVILVASSAGSTFGLRLAADHPELLHAYVGVDQNSTPDSAALQYAGTLGWLERRGQRRGMRIVAGIGPDYTCWTEAEFDTLVRWTIKANPHVPDMVRDVFAPAMLTSPLHSLSELRKVAKGMQDSMRALYPELVAFDARDVGTRFRIPFFVVQGDADLVTPTAAVRAYVDGVTAPHKEFIVIARCGHLAAFSRPDDFLRVLVDHVLPATGPAVRSVEGPGER